MFVRNLPSVPGSIYSKEDIKLFDKYRDDYRKFCDSVQETVDDIFSDNIYMIKQQLWWKTRHFGPGEWSCCADCNCYNIIRKEKNNDLVINLEPQYPGELISLSPINAIITAFYIPEDLQWFKIFNNGRLIGHYNRDNITPVNNDLETILMEANDFSFLENCSQESLPEKLLLKNKIQNKTLDFNYGDETIDISGVIHKRIMLIHPGIPLISYDLNIRSETSDDRDFYSEKILYKPDKSFSKVLFCNTVRDLSPSIIVLYNEEKTDPYGRISKRWTEKILL